MKIGWPTISQWPNRLSGLSSDDWDDRYSSDLFRLQRCRLRYGSFVWRLFLDPFPVITVQDHPNILEDELDIGFVSFFCPISPLHLCFPHTPLCSCSSPCTFLFLSSTRPEHLLLCLQFQLFNDKASWPFAKSFIFFIIGPCASLRHVRYWRCSSFCPCFETVIWLRQVSQWNFWHLAGCSWACISDTHPTGSISLIKI